MKKWILIPCGIGALVAGAATALLVSLNPIMVDGTGMCGGCRVTVGGEVKFACVDGPDFDGHKVDFAELMNRNTTYRGKEAENEANHMCRMDKLGKALIQ